MSIFNFKKKRLANQRKIDYLYHIVVAMARILKVNPKSLGSVTEDTQRNLDYVGYIMDQANKENAKKKSSKGNL